MEKASFFRKIFALFFSMVILLTFLLGAYLYTFYDITAREQKQEGVKQTEIHGLEIQKALEQMDGKARRKRAAFMPGKAFSNSCGMRWQTATPVRNALWRRTALMTPAWIIP